MLPVFLLTVSFHKIVFSINCIPDIIVVSRVSLISRQPLGYLNNQVTVSSKFISCILARTV
jgi:hypothetical protein